jgi:hypothetical protein
MVKTTALPRGLGHGRIIRRWLNQLDRQRIRFGKKYHPDLLARVLDNDGIPMITEQPLPAVQGLFQVRNYDPYVVNEHDVFNL